MTKRTTITPLSLEELKECEQWLDRGGNIPPQINVLLRRLLILYQTLMLSSTKASLLLHRLRLAMGLVPKSEKGQHALGKITPA